MGWYVKNSADDPLAELANALMRHPAFDRAANLHLNNLVQWRRDLGIFNRVATETGLHIVQYVILLHYNPAAAADGNGATFTNLLKLCQDRSQCGSRALRTTLAVSCFTRYLLTKPSDRDQRTTLYLPAPKLLREIRRSFAQALACIDVIVGKDLYAQKMLTDETFLPLVMETAGRAYLEQRLTVTENFPAVHSLIQLKGGGPAVIAIVDASVRGAPFPSPEAIAREFQISSSQVRNVQDVAKSKGLITIGSNGQVENAHELTAQFKGMLARELSLYAKYALGLEPYFCSGKSALQKSAAVF